MAQFIRLIEQNDNSVHYVNVDHIVQLVHVPNTAVATISTSDGRSFRIAESELRRLAEQLPIAL